MQSLWALICGSSVTRGIHLRDILHNCVWFENLKGEWGGGCVLSSNTTVRLRHIQCVFTVRDGDTVKHYRIRQLDEGGFFIARRATFRTLSALMEHYSRDADGLCVNLRKPCSQVCSVCFSNCCTGQIWLLQWSITRSIWSQSYQIIKLQKIPKKLARVTKALLPRVRSVPVQQKKSVSYRFLRNYSKNGNR